jgi:Calcium binding
MAEKSNRPVVVHMDVRKLKKEAATNLPKLSKAKLETLVEEATVDAYGDEEQKVGFLTMLQDHLALPFSVSILGVDAVVEKVDMTRDGRIVAICRREGIRQRVEILDLPLPKPAGSEWIAAYSYWSRGF